MCEQSRYKKILAALEEAMLSNLGVKSVTVGDQTIQFDNKKTLISLIQFYESRIRRGKSRFVSVTNTATYRVDAGTGYRQQDDYLVLE